MGENEVEQKIAEGISNTEDIKDENPGNGFSNDDSTAENDADEAHKLRNNGIDHDNLVSGDDLNVPSNLNANEKSCGDLNSGTEENSTDKPSDHSEIHTNVSVHDKGRDPLAVNNEVNSNGTIVVENSTNEEKESVKTETFEETNDEQSRSQSLLAREIGSKGRKQYKWQTNPGDGNDSGTEVDQSTFMIELESFHKQRNLEFKPPRFYGEGLNCLKLWRAVVRLGGYDRVTSCKLWRQVGETFKPPKTCTTVSWTFRCFYEKALLEYEKYQTNGEEKSSVGDGGPAMETTNKGSDGPCGRTRRDAAARAMKGWHSQRFLSNGDVSDPIVKEKNHKRDKHVKTSASLLKRKRPCEVDDSAAGAVTRAGDSGGGTVVEAAAAAGGGGDGEWVKVNVHRTKDCFEVYALVPGLLREEVRVQLDPAGRLLISGQPQDPDNPWGVTPFKKVVTLSSRISPHQTSAVVTLHGQLFVRLPFEHA